MAFNSALHPRVAKGNAGGGQFAKGSSPAPSKQPTKNGSRYSKKQFSQLQSLQKQHAAGKKLTAKQAHALHVAHELHLAHGRAMPVKRTATRAAKTAAPAAAPRKTAKAAVSMSAPGGRRYVP